MLIVWKKRVVMLRHSIVFIIQALNEILNQACQVVWLRREIPSFRLVNTHLLAWKSRVLSPPSHSQTELPVSAAKPLCWTCGWWCGWGDGLGCGAGCATTGILLPSKHSSNHSCAFPALPPLSALPGQPTGPLAGQAGEVSHLLHPAQA